MSSVRITKITLNNFKSYEKSSVEDLDPHTNVFIGKNGHGKSNIHHGKQPDLLKLPGKMYPRIWLQNPLVNWHGDFITNGLIDQALLFLLTDLTNGTGKIDAKTYINEINKAEEMSVIAFLEIKNNPMVRVNFAERPNFWTLFQSKI